MSGRKRSLSTGSPRSRVPLLLIVICITSLFVTSCIPPKEHYKPLHPVTPEDLPVFADDLDINSLITCARRQLALVKRKDPNTTVLFNQQQIPYSWLQTSIAEFLDFLNKHPDKTQLYSFLYENYQLFQAGGRKKKGNKEMLVTGYYEPLFAGSTSAKPPYLYPIYTVPPSLKRIKAGDGKSRVGRIDTQNNFVDYWSREEIENTALLQGYELAYLSDPFDAFLLHVQGSGRLLLEDASVRSVRYAGSNGLDYKSIGKLLVDEGIMPLEQVSIPTIRAHLEENPGERKRILQHNPRYIFFSWGDDLGPRGSSGEILTPGRSIALDASALPTGTIAYLQTRKPLLDEQGAIVGWSPLGRFVFPQDSGSAIKGTGRVDLFLGNGDYAEIAASNMKEPGALFFLVKKGYPKD